MTIAVVGAGAVGCYFGGMLARAGNPVVLIGRAALVEAVQRDGLVLEIHDARNHVPMQASTDVRAVQGAQCVLCCVKSQDTERAAAQMAPHLGPDALVLSLQNGVDNAERLRASLSCAVAPVAVYVAAETPGPGHVRHKGRGDLVMDRSLAAAPIARLFAEAGVPVKASDDMAGVLWEKLIVNCAYNALSAIVQQPYARLVEGEGVRAVMRAVVGECLALARAKSIPLTADVWAQVEHIVRSMPTQYSSTAQDLAQGKRSEIDHLNGYVVREARALGIPTPANLVLHSLVKLIESDPPRAPVQSAA